MKLLTLLKSAAIAATAAITVAGPAKAQSVEEFYSGKTIRLVISARPGGSSDFFGRQLAMFYGKHIPGNPDIVVENMSGAGGMVAATWLQNQADDDGTVLGVLQRNNLYRTLLDGNPEQFDPREVNWLGSINGVYYAMTVWHTAQVQSMQDMFDKELIVGATGFANENRTIPAIMNKYAGTKFNIIHGYSGSEETMIAMERGEVEARAATMNNLLVDKEAQDVAEGRLKPVMALGWKNHPAFSDLPNFNDIDLPPQAKSMLEFIILPFESGRPVAAPGGVPADRVAALRKAFDDTMADPEFIKHMEDLNSGLTPVSGERIDEILNSLWSAPPEVIEELQALQKEQS